jgi:hypothetical protein
VLVEEIPGFSHDELATLPEDAQRAIVSDYVARRDGVERQAALSDLPIEEREERGRDWAEFDNGLADANRLLSEFHSSRAIQSSDELRYSIDRARHLYGEYFTQNERAEGDEEGIAFTLNWDSLPHEYREAIDDPWARPALEHETRRLRNEQRRERGGDGSTLDRGVSFAYGELEVLAEAAVLSGEPFRVPLGPAAGEGALGEISTVDEVPRREPPAADEFAETLADAAAAATPSAAARAMTHGELGEFLQSLRRRSPGAPTSSWEQLAREAGLGDISDIDFTVRTEYRTVPEGHTELAHAPPYRSPPSGQIHNLDEIFPVNADEQHIIRVNPATVESEEAMIVMMAHEIYEIRYWAGRIAEGGPVPLSEVEANLGPSASLNVHERAWLYAREVLRRWRAR